MLNYSTPTAKEIAAEARRIILADFEVYDSIAELSKKTGTNSFRLKKIFRQQYGMTIFQFSRQARIDEAKKLLLETNYTIQTIAWKVGYSEGNNFQVSFKEVVGCTPGEYRKNKYGST